MPSFQVNMIGNTGTSNDQPSVSFSDTIVTMPPNTINTNTTNSVATGANATPVNTYVNLNRQVNSGNGNRGTIVSNNLLRNNATARNLQNPFGFNSKNPQQPASNFVTPHASNQNTAQSSSQHQQHQQQQSSGSNQRTNPPQQSQQQATPLPTPQSSQVVTIADLAQLMQMMMQSNQASLRHQALGSQDAFKALANSNITARVDQLPDISGRESAYEIKKFFKRLETVTQGMDEIDVIDMLHTKLEGRAADRLDEAINKLGYSDYKTIRDHLIETLSSTDIKRTNTFDMLLKVVSRKEKESLMHFGYRIYDMTRTALPDTPNIDMHAAQYFLKSLDDRELSIQLAGFINKSCNFEDILEKATIINNSRRNYSNPPQNQGGRMGNYKGQNQRQDQNFQNSSPNSNF